MNQQNEGLGSSAPSNVPIKRKRGRPRKEKCGVHENHISAMAGSADVWNSNQSAMAGSADASDPNQSAMAGSADTLNPNQSTMAGSADVSNSNQSAMAGSADALNSKQSAMAGSADVLNSNPTAHTTDGYQRQMVGKFILGVIEGAFDGGYLIKVQVADTDLRGVVFLPGRVVPVTVENDVAPHVRTIERKDVQIPVLNPVTQIPVLNPVTQVRKNSASSKKRNKQPFQPALQIPMPMPISQVRPTELQSDISVSPENQYASVVAPMADLPKIDPSVSTRGQAKESTTDGGATKDSQKIYEIINLVPTAENTEKELRTGQQSAPSVHKVNELIPDEPNFSDIEIEKMGEEVWSDWQI